MGKRIASCFAVIVAGLIFSTPLFAQKLPVSVNYDQSLAQMIRGAGFTDIIRSVNKENFPFVTAGTVFVEVELISFDGYVVGEDAEKRIAQLGYRPATLPEMLAVAWVYPEVLGKNPSPIIALGSRWKNQNGHSGVVAMRGIGNERVLYLVGSTVLGWHDNVRFAVVRRER